MSAFSTCFATLLQKMLWSILENFNEKAEKLIFGDRCEYLCVGRSLALKCAVAPGQCVAEKKFIFFAFFLITCLPCYYIVLNLGNDVSKRGDSASIQVAIFEFLFRVFS